jgi:glycosyltransferase involved in cell wall biosynthesis
MKLSVIVPVYNEENTISEILRKLTKIKHVKQVIVVDDGSQDTSVQIISKLQKKLPKLQNKKFFTLIKKENAGKGSAISEGLKKVTGDYVLIQDADCEYDPEDIPFLVEPVERGRAKIVYGSRFLGPHSNLLFWHRLGNSFLNFATNVLYDTTLSDMETCYKLLPTKLLKEIHLKEKNFDIEAEITCKLLKKKIRIFEVPISYVGRDYEQGKKITWKDGITTLVTILKLRFSK